MCAFVFQALLKVKRLKDTHDYSLMFNTPQEARVKEPLTTSKSGESSGRVRCNCNLCLAETVQVFLFFLLLHDCYVRYLQCL
jgi:hypothetical protein